MTAKWTKYGKLSGWVEWGKRDAAKLPGVDFWSRAVRVAAAAEGGKVDMVQCYDAGIMTAGPLGATARFGWLQRLLAKCLESDAQRFIETMQPAMFPTDGLISVVLPDPKVPTGYSMRSCEAVEHVATTDAALRSIFLGGSDGMKWDDEQKLVARRWVECLAMLLSGPFDAVVVDECRHALMRFAKPAENLLEFDAAGYTTQQQLGACFLAYAVNNPNGALRMLKAVLRTMSDRHAGAASQMLALAASGEYGPATFKERTARTRAALKREFG